MKLSRVTVAYIPLAFAALSAAAWAEGDASAGRQKTWTCEGCHGIADYRTAYPEVYPVPKLGGQSAGYIIKALQDYKTGARKNTTMRAIANRLNEQDMADIAAYYTASTGNR